MRRYLFILAAMLACFAPQAEAIVTPLPDLSESISAPAPAVAPDYIIEAVYPIGQADDGDFIDMVVCVEVETHTRVVCIVKSPLGLEIHEMEVDRYTPQGYWPYYHSDSWNPFEQLAVAFGNFGSLLVNTIDLGVDKLGETADRLYIDELEATCIANGIPDPGDALVLGIGGLSTLGAMVRTADRVEDAVDVLSDASRTLNRVDDSIEWVPSLKRWRNRRTGRFVKAPQASVYSARTSPKITQSVLDYIDPKRFSPDARFGKALYLAEDGGTAVAEVAHHGGNATHVIRYQIDLSKAKVLDLTDPSIVRKWGSPAGENYAITQAIAAKARTAGYHAIKFPSVRGKGSNYALFDLFDDILTPQMVSPTR